MTNLDKILDEIEELANCKKLVAQEIKTKITNDIIEIEYRCNEDTIEMAQSYRTDVPKLVKALGCAVEQLNFNASLYSSEAKEFRSKQALKQIENILGGKL